MSYKIYGREESPMLMIVSDDGWQVFSMTMSGVAPESREWLAKMLDISFKEEFDRVTKKAVNEHQAEMRKLLGMQS